MISEKDFEKIYLQYYPKLLVYGKTIIRDGQLIEDTIQELFITVWQRRAELSTESSLENYLFVAFRNNLIRKMKGSATVGIEQIEAREPEPLPPFEKEENLKAMLEQLPAHQREVIFLRYYSNKSYQEIAEILGINYQVARNFSYRAMKYLRENISKLSVLALSLMLSLLQ